MGETFPSAAQTDHFMTEFRGAVDDAFDGLVEAGDVAAAGKDDSVQPIEQGVCRGLAAADLDTEDGTR